MTELVEQTAADVEHPDVAQERRHLGATLEAIAVSVERPLKADTGTGDEAAMLAMEEYRAWRRVQLRDALHSPYFARIDFIADDSSSGRPQTFYIGKTFFEGGGVKVTGWQTPVSSLFYRATSRRCSYFAPDGEIHGEVRLKRRLTVDHGELFHIADDLLDASTGDEANVLDRQGDLPVMAAPRDPLLATLSGRASPWLRDIITTIQPEQYALIAAPADQVLVVQGVAGSGKTSIALHRLSFLIYPSLVAGTIPPRCIIFGPNRLFLKYISAVLPKLGLQRVVQTTVTERHLERLRLKNVRLTDVTFDALLDLSTPAEEKERLYQRSRLKTSRRMGALLERYVAWRRTRITIPEEGWSVQQTIHLRLGSKRLEHHIPADEIQKRHPMHLDRPFEVHRALFTESLWAYVNEQLEARGETAREEAKEKLALGRRRLQQAAEQRNELMRLKSARGGRPVAFGAPPVF
ncbi:MAG TPA: hypothetical protein VGW38_28825, partial [Chloroflexota bacterium]|nr:hypothetical protein [Chloroflexota bacterium]